MTQGSFFDHEGFEPPPKFVSPLDQADADRQRTAVVLASSMACADAIKAFLASDHWLLLHLAMLQDGTDLSPRTTPEPTLYKAVWPDRRGPLPKGCISLRPSMGINPALLVSSWRLIWFVDSQTPMLPQRHSAAWSCAVNAALGLCYGLTLHCFDEHGERISSPLAGPLVDYVREELAEWEEARREYTDRVRTQGLVLAYDWDATLMFADRGGAIDAGDLDFSQPLIWRVVRLENWMRSFPLGGEWTDEENAAFSAEIHAVAEDIRRELGTTVKIDGDW